MSLTVACNLRPLFGAIRDQGSRMTCVAFAVSDAHAVARGPFQPLSAEHLYYHAVRRTPGGHPDDGVSLETGLDALRLDGQAAESGWAYLDPFPADISTWKPPATAMPIFRREHDRGRRAINAIILELDQNRPVVVTFLMTESFFVPVNGFISAANPGPDQGYHAVLAAGYGRKGPQDLILVRNSWGPSWGMNGYGWVEVSYLAPRLDGIAMMGDETVL